ncbi:uncharacterized protein PRCAT00005915001 [Priceomyces carsonii]|uniref:uncharacterized protein n=1 Tax=Priceomyces carsonii TaxID=28549 RepID=UPI002ED83DE8|nr:unnamed protein product [Priceomyces carsonii]
MINKGLLPRTFDPFLDENMIFLRRASARLRGPAKIYKQIPPRVCPHCLIQSRYKSWINPLGRYDIKNEPSIAKNMIIEEPETMRNTKHEDYVLQIKHYLKSTDVPTKLRLKILRSNLSDLIKSSPDTNFTPDIILLLNKVFLELYEINDRQINDNLLMYDDCLLLFEKSLNASRAQSQNKTQLSQYMGMLSQYFLAKGKNEVPTKVLLHILDLASLVRHGSFKKSLTILLRSNIISETFTEYLFDHYETKGTVNLQFYEDILSASKASGNSTLLNDTFYKSYITHIENTFQDSYPEVHEYKLFERSIDRIDLLTNSQIINLIEFEKVSINILLQILKLISEISSVKSSDASTKSMQKILNYLTIGNYLAKLKLVEQVLCQQDFDDDTLVESLLVAASSLSYSKFSFDIVSFVKTDSIRFPEPLSIPYLIFQLCLSERTEADRFNIVKEELDKSGIIAVSNTEEYLNKILKLLLASGSILPNGPFIQGLISYFERHFGVERSVFSYKYQIDAAIKLKDHKLALELFDESLRSSWVAEMQPTLALTLNNLIILLCLNIRSIDDIFPIFTRIKQQMVNTTCNIRAIKALSEKMLESEYVGDLIEFLKRELPPIKKDDRVKLPIDKEFGKDYRELFDILHSFVITYTNEDSYETNWVLYGELHKYFNAPPESYLPAMKFFCDHDRLNASLLIFRQMRMLNELHGDVQHFPPLREIYMYLFQTFGDKFYQDGVEEIHESLKMDLSLQRQDIDLQNCVLNAYSNLQEVGKAKDLFLTISSNSKQFGGINEDTIIIMIKTYTYSDMMYVEKFWNNLSKYNIVPNYLIFRQYLIAHVYHGLVDDAFQLVDEMKDYDFEFTEDTMVTLYNYCLEKDKQERIAKWAQENHRELWDKAISSGSLRMAGDYMPLNNLIAESSS